MIVPTPNMRSEEKRIVTKTTHMNRFDNLVGSNQRL